MYAIRPLFIFSFCLVSLGLAAMMQPGEGDSTKKKTLDLQSVIFEDDPLMAQMDSLMVLSFFEKPDTNLRSTEQFTEFEAARLPDSIDWHDTVYQARIDLLNQQTPLELDYNPTVRAFIDLYAKKRREQVSRMLGLARYYFPLFEQYLDQYNMPLELKYLAVVESALNPNARSRVGATGLWQFMYSTGRLQGLKVSSYIDERSDPIRSTQAACEYLQKLYGIFGDWNLALAAYNSGPGNVSKAIRRSGGRKNYWEIRPFLPRETAGYVPAFIAVNYIMNHAEDHLIFPSEIKPSFFSVDTVEIKEQLSFAQIAKLIKIDEEELAFLNPAYRHKIIPKSSGDPYHLVLPADRIGLFVSYEDSIYALAAEDFKKQKATPQYVELDEKVRHRVQRGEVLGLIAEKYGVRVSSIRRWNGLRGNTIRVGQYLTIYPRKLPSQSTASKTTTPQKEEETGKEFIYYQVRSGESFYSIARKYPGISAQNIMSWNNYRNARSLKPGARLKIYQNI